MQKIGHITTDRAARYAKQVVSHMGRKLKVDEVDGGQRLNFIDFDTREDIGYVDILAKDNRLTLVGEAADQETADRITGVVWRHLVKFGERDGLTIDWE